MPDPEQRAGSCPSCGGTLPEGSRFCPHCGTPLGEEGGSTAVIQPPPDETGPVPVQRETVQPHLFGVTPPMALFALAVAALAVSILLLALGSRLVGAVVLVAALLLLVAFVAVARRKPDSGLARASASAVDSARDRLSLTYGSVATRSRARRRLAAIRAELDRLDSRRRALLAALGRAVYEQDGAATESVRDELAGLDRTVADKEAEMATIVEQARAEVSRAQLEAQATEMVEVPGTPDQPGRPDPARVPEPYPPPDEGNPPEPARTPEPYPPPDEGTPPQPAPPPETDGQR